MDHLLGSKDKDHSSVKSNLEGRESRSKGEKESDNRILECAVEGRA